MVVFLLHTESVTGSNPVITTKKFIVSWMSGLNRHPAKVLYVEIRTVGSNPTLTAKLIQRWSRIVAIATVL